MLWRTRTALAVIACLLVVAAMQADVACRFRCYTLKTAKKEAWFIDKAAKYCYRYDADYGRQMYTPKDNEGTEHKLTTETAELRYKTCEYVCDPPANDPKPLKQRQQAKIGVSVDQMDVKLWECVGPATSPPPPPPGG